MTVFDFISLFGGLALFLYGMNLMGDVLKRSSSGAMKRAMEKVTNNPFIGFLLGLGVTAVIQSSNATIVITSGLVGAGILSLHQSLGIILGANVGTTVTGQIIRLLDVGGGENSWLNIFRPSTLAPVAALIGIMFLLIVKGRRSETVGGIAMGFAILFTGLLSMTAAVAPLSQSQSFANIFAGLSDRPLLGFLIGTGVAFLIQSSSATVGILQALSVTGVLTLSAVYPIIIGVNIGVCITTALVCAVGSKADAKRTGAVHIIFNIFSAVLIVVIMSLLHSFGVLDGIWDKPMTSGGIANVNTIFRLASAVLLLPVCGQFEKLARRIIKDSPQLGESIDGEIEQLDEKFFASPALALASAEHAISKMASLSRTSVLSAMKTLRRYDRKAVEVINENEDHIDALADHVDNYLIRLSPYVPMGQDNDLLNYYIQCFPEFERIGDLAVNLTENAEDLDEKGIVFSEQARRELGILAEALTEILDHAYNAFTNMDMEAARHIEPVEEVMDDLVSVLRTNHIRRVREGKCTVYAGLTFLEILSNVERIADQCSNLGVYTLSCSDMSGVKNHHDYIQWLHKGSDPVFNKEYSEMHDKYFDKLEAIN
ncbi:MAG: Na/Pi cotransporter family protein [Clostridia bacterium]|nr:Na/Pi cotransporter family protein [Clostridia bacterium]